MGNRSSLLLRKEEIAQIRNETGCKYLVDKNVYDSIDLTIHVFLTFKYFLINIE